MYFPKYLCVSSVWAKLIVLVTHNRPDPIYVWVSLLTSEEQRSHSLRILLTVTKQVFLVENENARNITVIHF